MIYREVDQCRWCLDWLFDFCDKVIILLDNYDSQTEQVALEYKNKYPDRTYLVYSTEPVDEARNMITGQVKRRFRNRQPYIREQVIKELHRINKEESKVDLFIFLDSDEVPINEFPKYLEEFWYNQPAHDYMMLGFVEAYDSFRILISSRMAPHGRVYRYKPEMSALPSTSRTRYNPYKDKKPWKVRHVLVHLCYLTKEFRERRAFFAHGDQTDRPNDIWFLPTDVRCLTSNEISLYQPGHRQAPSKYPSISLEEFINNKDKYKEYL